MKIRYCDGASFSGYVKEELQVWFAYFPTNVLYNHYVRVLFCAFLQNGTRFYFRGQRIWEAVMNELVFKGLRNAKQVITCSTQLPSFTKKKKREKYISYYDTRHRNGWTVWINQSPSIFMNLLCSICVFNLIKWRLHHNNKMCHWCTISLIWIVSQRNTIWTGLWYWQLSVNNGLHYVLQ